MPVLLFALALVLPIAVSVCIVRNRRSRRAQREAVHRVRASRIYAHVYPLLVRCSEAHVEQVTLRRYGIYIRLYQPAGRMLTYRFEQHGFHPIPPEKMFPMAQALAVDFPALADHRKYVFAPRSYRHSNGEKEAFYEYNIVTAFKDSVLRSAYSRKQEA